MSPSGFPTKIVYAFLVSSVPATRPAHLIMKLLVLFLWPPWRYGQTECGTHMKQRLKLEWRVASLTPRLLYPRRRIPVDRSIGWEAGSSRRTQGPRSSSTAVFNLSFFPYPHM
jgi:hypothetical protein